MNDWKWQWVSDHYGPMGWFTAAEKRKHQKTFTDGHWRKLSADEVASFKSYVGRLAYEQS